MYKMNTKLRTIILLGQGKSHGMALLSKTKSDDYPYPNGLAWEFMNIVKKDCHQTGGGGGLTPTERHEHEAFL
jgi:hypothetical protein